MQQIVRSGSDLKVTGFKSVNSLGVAMVLPFSANFWGSEVCFHIFSIWGFFGSQSFVIPRKATHHN